MNKEVARINEKELQLGIAGSWHDQYKDSAYVYIGNLPRDLTEGDVITIMSQYGEVMDVNLPRDKQTGKLRGFGFLMYEDQRSTILAVDNLNGAQVLDRTIRVDHVSDYKQPKQKNDDGELIEVTEQSLNAKPELLVDDGNASSSDDEEPLPAIDPDDPMRDYLLQQHREERERRKKKRHSKRANETPEERRERKRRKKEKKERKAIEARRPHELEYRRERAPEDPRRGMDERRRSGSPRRERPRSRSRTPPSRDRQRPRSRSPGRRRDYRD
ncbi:hypothetical protein EXIGLDRAFT_647834 [Exidia glandulosa HHB12029]|uniref:RRM domain-containing protein n=1 Tax=Exidia glandulosa HHB12029 TaxID=1314781 RepID=A0A166AH83_EXIGL|nr:hypothetical protein EXIGLDRAFT_647834 [Exidia glandulosa HHB12029]